MNVTYIDQEIPSSDKTFLVSSLTGTSAGLDEHLIYTSGSTFVSEFKKSGIEPSYFELLISRASLYPLFRLFFITLERTSTINHDYEMFSLETMAIEGDENKFVEVANAINWDIRPIQDFLKAIKLALRCGAHMQARKLAESGRIRFPENNEIHKFSRILAPSRVIDRNLPPDQEAAADMHWLKTFGGKYREKWVALRGGVLQASASSRKELLTQLENPKDKSILITLVY